MRRAWTSMLAGALLTLAGACVSSSFREGQFVCDPQRAPECPPGLTCASDGRCRSRSSALVDASPDDAALPPADVAPLDAPAADVGADAARILLGDPGIGGAVGTSADGRGTAFPFVALATGNVTRIYVHLDVANDAGSFDVALYSDAFSQPWDLLVRGNVAAARAGTNTLTVLPTRVEAGSTYWIALLTPSPGELTFNANTLLPTVQGQMTSTRDLTTFPARWPSGATFLDPPLCAYATE